MAPMCAHVRVSEPHHAPECTHQGAPARAPMSPFDLFACTLLHQFCTPQLHIAPIQRLSAVTSHTLCCPICPNAPPLSALLAPSLTPSKPKREQGANWGRRRCIVGRSVGAVGAGPIGCPGRAQAARSRAMQRLSRVNTRRLGDALAQLYRAWASSGV